MQLGGLTQQEVGELVESSLGITLTLEDAEIIHNRTVGNPFFVAEVTRQFPLENTIMNQGWSSIIPEGVQDAIGRRLNRLSDHCNDVLTTASVTARVPILRRSDGRRRHVGSDPADWTRR